MDNRFVTHDTFVIEKTYDASPAMVFAAWAEPSAKAMWFGKSDEFDFRVGGREKNLGGPPGGPVYTFEANYQEIVPDKRIIYSYNMDLGDVRISVSIATIEFISTANGTQLIFTEQGAFLDGHDKPEDRYHGTKLMLDKLGDFLRGELADEAPDNTKPISDREIVNTRIFNMSRERIFEAFVNPDHLIHWWGPKGFTNTFHEIDMRPGGIWRHTLHGPNGDDYENESVFIEIVKPERFAIRHVETVHEFVLTITLAELEGKTELTWRQVFESADECARVREFCHQANEQNMDRLAAQLAQMA